MSYKIPIDHDLEQLGQTIRRIREESGYTKEQFIAKAELGKYYYYRIEYGNANPSVRQLRKIADALSVNVADLIEF
jgi:transcriptional regulator with XRE-family HTH domain